ncbi:MAG: hypothetical protein ABH834_05680, partial [Candidatus Altiarchaeota archaeon]
GPGAARVTDIDTFKPPVAAPLFTATAVPVILNDDIPEFDLMGVKWGPYTKEAKTKLPEYAAIYLMLKGAAEAVK